MITYKVYDNGLIKMWDEFISQSINGTIFQLQKFLSYHIERNFKDHSLMFYKNNKLIGLFAASEVSFKKNEKILFSHPGASFGGIVQHNYSLADTLEMVDLIESYARENQFNQISIIPMPSIYSENHDDSLIYALKLKQYDESERYYSSIIPLQKNLDVQLKLINNNKGRGSNYYNTIIKDNNLRIEWSNNFDEFYPILLKNKKKYNCKPTHSLEEIVHLHNIMPEKIKLLIIKKNNETIGGNLIFIANSRVAIIFYNMINYKYAKLQIAVIQIIETIKWAYENNLTYLDFGVSHEAGLNNFLIPKMSLIKFKEEFGAFGSVRTLLNKKI